jgi:hypothetical protein
MGEARRRKFMSNAEKTARGTVANGRTIVGADPDKPKRIVGMHPETGAPITMAATKVFEPGEEFESTPEEIMWLRSTGHIIDPKKLMSDKEAERVPPLRIDKSGGVGFVNRTVG